MPFVVRIHRPDKGPHRRGWDRPLAVTAHRKLEEAQEALAVELATSTPTPMDSLRTRVLRARALHAKPGEHIEVGEYDHWIEEEP